MENISSKQTLKLHGLDHLRVIAILLVCGFHYQLQFSHPNWTVWFMKIGWTGVDLFFVLSGFLISSQLFAQIKKGNGFSLKIFFIRRFFRIVPLYFFIVAVYFLFPYFRERETLPPLWKFLTFTQNFGLDFKHFGTFAPAWSLCVEEHFYLLLPLILIFLQGSKLFAKSYWFLICLFLFGILFRNYLWDIYYNSNRVINTSLSYWAEHFYYPTYNRLDGLLVGVALASLYQFLPNIWDKILKFGDLLIILSITLLIVIFFLFADLGTYRTSIFGFPLISIAYGLLVAGAISPSSFLYKLESRTSTLIATLSYAIYLSHKGVIHIVQELLKTSAIDKDSNLMFVICIGVTFLVALVLNQTIGKPFMNLRAKIIEKNISND